MQSKRVYNLVSVLPCVVREHGGQALHGFVKRSAVWRLQAPGRRFVLHLSRSRRLLDGRERAVGGRRRRDGLCSRRLQHQQERVYSSIFLHLISRYWSSTLGFTPVSICEVFDTNLLRILTFIQDQSEKEQELEVIKKQTSSKPIETGLVKPI